MCVYVQIKASQLAYKKVLFCFVFLCCSFFFHLPRAHASPLHHYKQIYNRRGVHGVYELYYIAYIKPQFDYCSIIWSNASNFNVNKINKLQRRACKLILSNDYTCLNESLEQLNIMSFDQSVFLNKAKIMYKIYNNLAPSYLHEMFQMREVNLDSTLSNLRSVANRHYVLPQARCNLFKGSLSFSGVLIWNSIPIDIRNSSSLHMFSKRCSEWIRR